MTRHRMLAVSSVAICLFCACHSSGGANPAGADSAAVPPIAASKFKPNPEQRDHVKKDPVAEYQVKTDDKLNDGSFSVRLFETPETMQYVAKVEYDGITGADTIRLPDIGTPPHPVLQKGPEKYSCIIGLEDNDKNFREMKKVYVTEKGNNLKISTLRHYTVTTYYSLVAQ